MTTKSRKCKTCELKELRHKEEIESWERELNHWTNLHRQAELTITELKKERERLITDINTANNQIKTRTWEKYEATEKAGLLTELLQTAIEYVGNTNANVLQDLDKARSAMHQSFDEARALRKEVESAHNSQETTNKNPIRS